MKISTAFLVMLSIVLTLASCRSAKPVVSTESETYVRDSIVERDTVYVVEADSSYYRAYIECINSSPVIREVIKEVPGADLKIPSVSIKDNMLQVDCYKGAQELFAKWKENHKEKVITKTITITKEVNRLNDWQKLRLMIFNILVLIVAAYFSIPFIKSKFL